MLTITEVVLIITLGYSPSGATGVTMHVAEYVQPNMEKCKVEEQRINKAPDGRFAYFSICVERIK